MSDEILPAKELLDFMVANAIYPMYSKKGKVYLRCSKKGLPVSYTHLFFCPGKVVWKYQVSH